MLTLLVALFGILLLVISWFFFTKALDAFSIVIPERKQTAFSRFCTFNGWAYLFFGLVSFAGFLVDAELITALLLVFISLYTAGVAWQIAAFIKK